MDIEQQILCLAARTRLDTAAEEQLLELLRRSLDWERLWAQGHLHEVLPLLAMNLRRLQDQAAISPIWMARAQQRMHATLVHNTILADELLRVLTAFQHADIKALPFKGVVLAEMFYGNLALRPMGDLDVLVHPSALPAARTLLRGLGFVQHTARPDPIHDPPYFRQVISSEVCLELHWALWVPQRFKLQTDVVWKRAVTTHLRGMQVHVLSPEDMLLHLVMHRARQPLRLRWVCDIAEFLGHHHTTLDWDYVLQQADIAAARAALFCGLALAQELLAAPLPPDVLPRLGISRIKQQLLQYICGARALFRPAVPADLSQEPDLAHRLLMLDSVSQTLRALQYRAGLKET